MVLKRYAAANMGDDRPWLVPQSKEILWLQGDSSVGLKAKVTEGYTGKDAYTGNNGDVS